MSNTVQLIDNNGIVFLTGSSIQATSIAVNNLSLSGVDVAGWVIKASAGLYIEHVILTNGVTLQGANAGIDGANEARGPETVITGGVEVRGDGATVDGVKILGSFDTITTPSIDFQGNVGIAIVGAGTTIENSVFSVANGDGRAQRPFVTTTDSLAPGIVPTDLILTDNLVQGWSLAAQLTTGGGAITDNTFSGNTAGSIIESEMRAFDVSGNSFSGTPGFASDVSGATAEASFHVENFVHDNTYSETATQPIKVELSGPDGQVVTGTDTPTLFNVSYHIGAAEIHGGAGSDTISYVNATFPATIDLGAGTAQSPNGTITFTSIENATGSALGSDSITGDDGANVLDGSGGDDTIAGKGGNDTLIGGAGNDTLDGGDGNDSLNGGSDNDTASYADAGSAVTVSLAITDPQDTGGAGTDTLISIENLTGSAFNDVLTGDSNANVLSGLDGNDTLNGGDGDDTLDGGDGTDTASYADAAGAVAVSLAITTAQDTGGAGTDTLASIENLTGSAFNDVLTGDAGANVISGLAGNDTLDGGDGTDTASYADAASGVTVSLAIGTAQDTIGAGTDTLTNIENLTGSGHNDTLTGDAGNNTLNGGAGDDSLSGGAGDDTLDGGAGTDTAHYTGTVTVTATDGGWSVDGGAGEGTDTLSNVEVIDDAAGGKILLVGNGGYATIQAAFDAAAAGDTIQIAPGDYAGSPATTAVDGLIVSASAEATGIAITLGGTVHDITLLGDSDIDVTGNGLANVITGNDGNNSLSGLGGNDTLIGGLGDDTLDGGDGTDTASYADAASGVIVKLAEQDTLQDTGGAGLDLLHSIENLTGSAFNDVLTGDDGANVISGLAGNDTLNGGDGNDTLDGGDGTDRASYADAASAVTVSLAVAAAQDTGGAGTDTLVGIENLTGSDFADTLTGDAGANVINALDGNDTLNGGAGDDTLDGGDGNDTASYEDAASGVTVSLAIATAQDTGGAGNDTLTHIENLTGSAFDDKLTGDAGANVINGLDGDDTLQGGAGNDSLDGGDGNDTASYKDAASSVTVSLALQDQSQDTGGAGLDILTHIENLTGSAFDDTLTGDDGNNAINGLAGNDILNGGAGNDTLDGGDGGDTASYADAASGVTVSLAIATAQDTGGAGNDTLLHIENLTGSAFADTLTGDDNNNVINGLAGNDTLQGGAGTDFLDGGDGNDTASYKDAASGVTVSLALQDRIQDTDGAGVDKLTQIENLTGSAFDDRLTGDDGDNVIKGLAGNDTLNGGAGENRLDGGDGTDTASYSDADAAVSVSLVEQGISHDTGGAGIDTYVSIENLTGSGFSDFLGGDSGDNLLRGGDGDDGLDGGAGNDTLDGGTGNDSVTYQDAAAGVTVSLAISTAQDTHGVGLDTLISIENLTGTVFGDTLTGDAGANILDGATGDDTLEGGGGNDALYGGDGIDTVSYAGAAAAVNVSLALQDAAQNTIGAGSDTLTGFENLTGSAFDDTLGGDTGNNRLNGGGGIDTASYADATAGVTVSLAISTAQNTIGAGTDTLSNFENLTGSAFNDTLAGNAGDNVLDGGAGNDTANYEGAASRVIVDLSLQDAPQNTMGAGSDTLIGIENLTGSSFNDLLAGDGNDNTLSGGDGTDVLTGGDGDDGLDGGAGNDTANYEGAAAGVTVNLALTTAQNTGGAGIDTLSNIEAVIGSLFNDTLTGNAGDNVLGGDDGDDILNGGAGNDILVGGNGVDTASYVGAASGVTVSLALTAAQNTIGAGTDTLIAIENLTGSALNDTLTGDLNANRVDGGAGNDILNGGAGNDSLIGGTGIDTASYASATGAVTVSLAIAAAQNTGGAGVDTLATIENLTGSNFNDTLTGNTGANILNGGAGNDTLNGGAGNDSLVGGTGIDTASYAGATAAVTVSLAIAAAQNTIGAGVDTLATIENLTGSNFNDTLTGSTLANVLNGGVGNDALAGGAGNDSLTGAAGNDTLNGGAGNDSMDGGAAGTDTASYQAGATAGVTVNLALTTAQNTIGAGVDTLVNFENLTGTAFNDTLTGNTGANVIDGLAGNDSLSGGAGNDTLTGGVGNDTVNGGAGNDHMDGGAAGTDSVSYETGATAGVKVSLAITTAQNTLGAGTDTLLNFENLTGSGFNDTLAGNAGANTLSGLAGNDSLNGAAGIDSLSGGAGNDRLIGGAGNDSLDGGAGADSFIFDKGFGKDIVTGFVATGAAHDKIDFSTATFANFAAVHSHMAQSGANVIITLDSADTITIKNVTVASLTAADFTFHPGTAPAAPAQAVAAAWATHGAEFNTQVHHV